MKELLKKCFSQQVSLRVLQKDWLLFRELVEDAAANNDIAEMQRLLQLITTIGYSFNFLESYGDGVIDEQLKRLAAMMPSPTGMTPPREKMRFVFYDYFALPNRGFTQQYLEYFHSNQLEVLYIFHEKSDDAANALLRFAESSRFISLCAVPAAPVSTASALGTCAATINAFGAEKIIFQNAPQDIFSYLLALKLKDAGHLTFLLNITDHAYWQGQNIFDYFIEFRSYGASLNVHHRGIRTAQEIIIPTPAPVAGAVPFQGFPADTRGKVIGFGGGHVYKIRDRENTYLNLVRELLEKHDSLIFFFANVGDTGFTQSFIDRHHLQGRLVPLGNRNDISGIFNHIDLFFNTYPYGGGNMQAYAAMAGVPIISLYKKGLEYTRVDAVLDIAVPPEMITHDREKYLAFASALIGSKDQRKVFADKLKASFNIDTRFAAGMQALLAGPPFPPIVPRKIEINHEEIRNFHRYSTKDPGFLYFYYKAEILKNKFVLFKYPRVSLFNLRLLKRAS